MGAVIDLAPSPVKTKAEEEAEAAAIAKSSDEDEDVDPVTGIIQPVTPAAPVSPNV